MHKKTISKRIKIMTNILLILFAIYVISIIIAFIIREGEAILWLLVIPGVCLLLYSILFGIVGIKEGILKHKQEQQLYQNKLKEEQSNPMITCKTCQNQISKNASACPRCGEPMPRRCPKCNSADIERIKGAEKGVSAVMLGAFAANTILSDYYCKACGEKFK